MRTLFTGGRKHYASWSFLDKLQREHRIGHVIVGDATGVDYDVYQWARARNMNRDAPYKADWEAYGNYAGPIRNAQMLKLGYPALVIAFPGGRGTLNMVQIAERAGIRVVHV